MRKAERFSSFSHLAGVVGGVLALIVLVILSWGNWDIMAVSVIYALAVISLFSFSTIYHALKKQENEINVWRKLDHIAIFIMIAGTYTPMAYIYLDGGWRLGMLIATWAFVLIGVFQKVFFLNAPRWLSPVTYLGMGWMAVFPLREFWLNMPPLVFWLIACGGLAYSIGAVIYGIKKPNPVPGVFGFHEIFHALILLGWAFHLAAVILAILG
nr:hemolysin III family protein [Dehalococcoides mccartyi]